MAYPEQFSEVWYIDSIFKGCTALSAVPSDIFYPFVNAGDCAEVFAYSGIKSLSPDMFSKNRTLSNLRGAFRGCVNLTEIPELLFANNREGLDWDYIFYGCINAKFNQNIFCDEKTEMKTRFTNGRAIGFSYAFSRDSFQGTGKSIAPQLWNYSYDKSVAASKCFGGAGNTAQSITNYGDIPSGWK